MDDSDRFDAVDATNIVHDAIVAIPIHNEQDHIGACLAALAGQIHLAGRRIGLVLFLNNCVDSTEQRVAEATRRYPHAVRVVVEQHATPSAGWARRRAMDIAVAWLGELGDGGSGDEAAGGAGRRAVLTTDADTVVPPGWVSDNLAAIAAGADAVAGRIELDRADAALLPAALHARGALEGAYEALLTEVGARLDPTPGNPWPTHWTTSGATFGVTRAAYLAVGGMPELVSGEDRAFAERIRAHDLRLRHDPGIVVSTSGRLVGRAVGGAADTMSLRCVEPDSPCDDRLETFSSALRRVMWRKRLRALHVAGTLASDRRWSVPLDLDDESVAACLVAYEPGRRFGAFHAELERVCPRLAYRPLPPSRLGRQITIARAAVTLLRLRDRLRGPGRRADTPPFAPRPTRPWPPQPRR